jgi:hypothetical protein
MQAGITQGGLHIIIIGPRLALIFANGVLKNCFSNLHNKIIMVEEISRFTRVLRKLWGGIAAGDFRVCI